MGHACSSDDNLEWFALRPMQIHWPAKPVNLDSVTGVIFMQNAVLCVTFAGCRRIQVDAVARLSGVLPW